VTFFRRPFALSVNTLFGCGNKYERFFFGSVAVNLRKGGALIVVVVFVVVVVVVSLVAATEIVSSVPPPPVRGCTAGEEQ